MKMIPSLAWFAAGIVLIGLEFFVPGFIVYWIGASALLTSLLSMSHILSTVLMQVIFFSVLSSVLLLLWIFVLKKKIQMPFESGMRSHILSGIRGAAISHIGPGIIGEVDLYESFHGITRWRAESFSDIIPGDKVVVIEARGFRIVVKKEQRQDKMT